MPAVPLFIAAFKLSKKGVWFMSKPFTYWVRLAMVATLCTLVTFSPVNAGRLMDRLLHRDACKTSATECCEPISTCEPSYLVVPCAPCPSEPVPHCGCEPGKAVPPTVMHSVPKEPAADVKPSSSVPHVVQPAPVVDAPKIAPPKAIAPDPVVSKPPVIDEPPPVVAKPAPAVAKPAPVFEEPKKPADDIFGDAPAVTKPSADPFGEPPAAKQPADELFGDAPAAKQPVADPFGEAPVVQKPADDLFGDPPAAPAVEPSAIKPEMPAAPPAKTELDDLFDTKPAPSTAVESSLPKVDDLFGAETKATEPVTDAKPAETSIDDLFNSNEKPAAPPAETSIDDLFGKPIAVEFDSAQGIGYEEPVKNEADKEEATNKSPAQEEASIDSLFGIPSDPAVNVSEPAEPEKVIEEPSNLPTEEKEPAKAKEQVDELDALFGVGAFTAPSEFSGAEFRQWIDNSGAYQVEARLAVIYVDKVKLLKANGKFTTVPLSRLSEADFGYVSWVASNLTTEQTARMVKTESHTTESDVSR